MFDCSDKSDESGCEDVEGDCDFDSSGPSWKPEDCGWTQSLGDQFEWDLADHLDGGGPESGHDVNTGNLRRADYFIYAPANYGNRSCCGDRFINAP